MKYKYNLSVVLPCYRNIEDCIITSRRIIDIFRKNVEIVVVLDGGLPEQKIRLFDACKHFPQMKIIIHNKRLGKGGAVRSGVLHSSGKYIAFIDADGAIHPRYLLKLFDILENERSIGGVVGFRVAYHTRLMRRIAHAVFHLMVHFLIRLRFKDTQTAIKMLRAPIAKRLFQRLRIRGYAFDVELLFWAVLWGVRLKEVPVTQKYTESSMSIRAIFTMATDILRLFHKNMSRILFNDKIYINSMPLISKASSANKCCINC